MESGESFKRLAVVRAGITHFMGVDEFMTPVHIDVVLVSTSTTTARAV
ncbi:MAG: hypothetical protein GY927_04610 [bacterium]|nr:hypothetical protein [bacterium]